MRMRNPLKPKSKRRQFAELQEDTGFTPEQFTIPEPQSAFFITIKEKKRKEKKSNRSRHCVIWSFA